MPDYVDDPTISDDADLWRRIHRDFIVPDSNTGKVRASSAAFKDHPNGSPMSVLLADVMAGEGLAPADALEGYENQALVALTAGVARECDQGVAREPLEGLPAHAVVFGRKTKRIQRKMARASRWVIPPPGV